MDFPIDRVRAAFPALSLADDGRPRVYFDNPAGTQVPGPVIARMIETLRDKNANLGGYFTTTRAAAALLNQARRACATFYHAASPREIVFGQNMTSLTLHMSRCLGRDWKAGDEIVLTRMEHDANVSPWLLLAEDKGLKVRWIDFNPDTYEFADDAIDGVLSERTRLVALGYASNCTGTINDVAGMAKKARAAGALTYVDAVQLAPHCAIDVQALACDFLVSSAYKWFGPHQGILWGREEVLERTFAYKLRPAGASLPDKFETGTQSHEGIAGCLGALEYLSGLGGGAEGAVERQAIVRAFDLCAAYEQALGLRLIEGLRQFKGLTVRGITSANAMHRRVPTVSFTLEGHHPQAMAKALAAENIFVWSGHNYAIEPINRMGLMDQGGVLRAGLAHYNTAAEVDGFLTALRSITR